MELVRDLVETCVPEGPCPSVNAKISICAPHLSSFVTTASSSQICVQLVMFVVVPVIFRDWVQSVVRFVSACRDICNVATVVYSVVVSCYIRFCSGRGCVFSDYLLHVLHVILIKFLVVHFHLLQQYPFHQDVPAIISFQRRSPIFSPIIKTATTIQTLVWLSPCLLLSPAMTLASRHHLIDSPELF